ncbi:putative calcium-binding protein CML21 [Acorus gramineus]|uniref:Calcium-binding protein CML21 n=1 Tax=Acorus gramineus TaxID=55184 RepID=A0AAV9B2F7_ACOGR|nr:putative calcium-binding protein CML21 [Acorus gramineus]
MLSPQLKTAFDTIIDAFLFLDKNGDGKLNKKELILALNEASPWERSPSHIAMTRLKEMDWDKNGEISLKEFLFALTKWVGMDSVMRKSQLQANPILYEYDTSYSWSFLYFLF